MSSWLRVGAAEPVTASHLDFFEKKIRPVLVDKCYSCHSAQSEKVKGGLTLDTREEIRRGGDSGSAVVPGNLDESLLIQAIRYENDNFAMPPAKSGGKLPASVIRDFEEWVRLGAPDPREGAVAPVANRQEHWEKAKAWWAWQPPKPHAVPAVRDASWPLGDIDRFVLAAQERKGGHPVGDADKLTLVRRVYFDLIGLPPSPEQAQAFLTDKSTNAMERVVDRLLPRGRPGANGVAVATWRRSLVGIEGSPVRRAFEFYRRVEHRLLRPATGPRLPARLESCGVIRGACRGTFERSCQRQQIAVAVQLTGKHHPSRGATRRKSTWHRHRRMTGEAQDRIDAGSRIQTE